jgi:hypothetical protein
MHLLVTIDKFSKWIEVRPITIIRSKEAVKFFTDIIHHLEYQTPSLLTMAHSSREKGSQVL